jgi:hypothetical protein
MEVGISYIEILNRCTTTPENKGMNKRLWSKTKNKRLALSMFGHIIDNPPLVLRSRHCTVLYQESAEYQ